MRLVSKNMIGRGLLVLAVMSTCVLSLPLTPSQMENEDVKVMKCIVEALADVLSRPHPVPVSEECLVTLKTDDRLVSILRHHNFLNELQEIAVQGHQERAQRQRDAGKPRPTTEAPQTDSAVADRSMLEALGGPGERSILSQERRTGNGDGEEVNDESQGEEVSEEADMAGDVQVKRENDKRPRSHSSESSFESSESRAEKREEEKEENEKEGENSEEENMMTTDKKETGSGEKREEPRKASKKKFEEEDEDEIDKRSPLFPHKQEEAPEEQEDDEEEETTSMESIKRWAKRGKASPLTKEAGEKEAHPRSNQPEVPHHSQEASKEEEEKKKREVKKSPEEKELQSIAREGPEERRDLEEEGSASRKSEEPEIESLAAIESELENVAQKLHELRQG